ncbi:MAG: aryl-sulfate sulfotransferase [Candidatus Dormibacter sp.]|uniref:aryl-sulfate sulfotransferase n=1 Tax=Candidatus Dormibacter sp. TaxID=2973982 RepID=UPI003D9BB36E
MTAASFSAALSIRPARADVPADQVDIPVAGSPLSNIVTASPYSLTPGFLPAVHDYVVRCQTGVNQVTFTLVAMPAGSIQVGYQSGSTATVTVGLAESQAAVVQATDPNNPAGQIQYWIRCLPHDFPQMNVSKPGTPSPGWYLTGTVVPAPDNSSSTYAMILDENGTPVWYQPAPGGAINVELLPYSKNTLAWAPSLGPGVGSNPNGAYNLYQLDTQTSSSLAAPVPPTDPHELLQLANGNRMMIATPLQDGVDLTPLAQFNTPQYQYAKNGTIVDCVIEELDPQGKLVGQLWRASKHINVGESNRPAIVNYNGKDVADIFHCNSIDDSGTGDMLVSMRHTDAVYRITKATGLVAWKMGGNQTPLKDPGAKHLSLTGDSEGGFFGQHDARFRMNGSSTDVTLYDDHSTSPPGCSAPFDCNNSASPPGPPARGVEYAINDQAGTANWLWEYRSPDGQNAPATGGFRRSPDGNDNVIAWGFKSGSGFTEVDATGAQLLDVTYPNGDLEYRAVKVAPGALDPTLLRQTAGLPRPSALPVAWQGIGGLSLTSKPGAASWAPNRFDVFARGPDQQMGHLWWDGTQWYGWEPLGGVLASGPGAAARGPGLLDVFVRGTDDQLYHRWWDGTQWNGWEALGGVLRSSPTAASWSAGRLDVMVQGTDSQIWHKFWDGSQWSGWEPLGGQTNSDPAVTSWGAGRLDLFIRNVDGTLGHRWYDGGQWSTWEWFAGSLSNGTGPSAAASANGELDVIVSGTANVLQRLQYNGGWRPWQSLGGATPQTPSVVKRDLGAAEVFVTGTDGALYHEPLSSASPARTRPMAPPNRGDASKL